MFFSFSVAFLLEGRGVVSECGPERRWRRPVLLSKSSRRHPVVSWVVVVVHACLTSLLGVSQMGKGTC